MSRPGGSRPRVVVVGAGLAGLRAATLLARRDFEVVVLEARAGVGGRATGEWSAGHWMDAAWPVLGGRDASLARFARELGLGDALLPLRPVQTVLLHDGERRPVDGLGLRGAARIPGLRLWEAPRLLRWRRLMRRHAPLLDPAAPERAASLDYRSLRDHVALYFGRGALDAWITPEIQSAYGDDVGELSRVALLLHAVSRGLGERRPGLPGLPRRPLAELAQTAAERLDVRRATAALRIDEQPAGGFRIETRDAERRRGELACDALIVATGAPIAAQIARPLLTPAERDHFAALRERTAITLAIAVDGIDGGLPQEVRLPRGAASAVASFLIEPGHLGGRSPEGQSQIVALARDGFAERWRDMPDDVVTKNLLGSLEDHVPGLGDRILATHLGRARVPFFRVGHYRLLASFEKVQRDRRALGRRLYWAGDHVGGPGFEAATRSGERAAESVTRDLGADAD